MGVTFDKEKLVKAIRRGAAKGVALAAIKLQSHVRTLLNQKGSNLEAGGIASYPGEPPAMGNGGLWKSIQAVKVTSPDTKPTWRVGSNLIYARVQELGGIITGKKGMLAVPIGVEGRRAARNAGGDLRKLNLVFIKNKKYAMLWGPVGGGSKSVGIAGKKLIPLFILKKSVMMPARPYFRPAIKIFGPQLQNIIRDSIAAEMKGAA